MKKSFVVKISIIIILILAFAVIHDVILSIKIERTDNNKETNIVEKEVSTNEETSSIEDSQEKEVDSWVKCQENLTCYLDEGEYKIGNVVYSTSILKTPDNIPFPYPTEEDVDKENSFIKNHGLRVEVTNDNSFIMKGTNYEEELTLNYDSLGKKSIMSVTSGLLNYAEQRYFSTSELDEDVFFSTPGKDTILGYYSIDVMEMNGELYIAIYTGSVCYIHTLDKI